MGRTKYGDGIKSNQIISEVQKRPCLYDTNDPNYGDRSEKTRCWEEVCETVVPGWLTLGVTEKFAAGKEVQKRWRSIRDSYTKTYRQGKCVAAEQCTPGSRRYMYHRQMEFLLRALQTKKPRYSQDRFDSYSELSNSSQNISEDNLKIKTETIDKPLDLKTKQDTPDKPGTMDKCSQTTNKNQSLEIKIDANSILPEDHFDDDKLFMDSLIPFFKKMSDDTRLSCRVEVLKVIRYALQGHNHFEELRKLEDRSYKDGLGGMLAENRVCNIAAPKIKDLKSMTTRSADGSRPKRKHRMRSPSPLPVPTKRRGPGRPRKVRPPPSETDEEQTPTKKRCPKLRVPPIQVPSKDVPSLELEDSLSRATSVAQLSTPMFMKVYNLERTKVTPSMTSSNVQVSVKTEPTDEYSN